VTYKTEEADLRLPRLGNGSSRVDTVVHSMDVQPGAVTAPGYTVHGSLPQWASKEALNPAVTNQRL